MDPFVSCQRLYDPHFSDGMKEHYLPDNQIALILKNGRKIPDGKGKYKVRWNKWTIVVSVGNCFLRLITVYPI